MVTYDEPAYNFIEKIMKLNESNIQKENASECGYRCTYEAWNQLTQQTKVI